MELYKEILAELLTNKCINVRFDDFQLNVENAVEQKCYKTLKRIKEIIDDDLLDDKECYQKIEAIICEFESIGSNSGNRHDF